MIKIEYVTRYGRCDSVEVSFEKFDSMAKFLYDCGYKILSAQSIS